MRTHGWAYAILDDRDRLAQDGDRAQFLIFKTLREAIRERDTNRPACYTISRVYLETEPFALLGNGREKV